MKLDLSKLAFSSVIAMLASFFKLDEIGYSSDSQSIETFFESFESKNSVVKSQITDKIIAYEGENVKAGLIFYPGANVDYTSYEPLMAACAEQGIMSFVVKMPFNFAFLDINAAKDIKDKYPEIKDWYIGGHSLGGVAAGIYVCNHLSDFKGIIFLASYTINNISKSNLKVLSIYGSEDEVLNLDSYNKYKTNLPADFKEIIIEGGCHSQFGMYGAQKGDGTPTISTVEQIELTVAEIDKFIEELS